MRLGLKVEGVNSNIMLDVAALLIFGRMSKSETKKGFGKIAKKEESTKP